MLLKFVLGCLVVTGGRTANAELVSKCEPTPQKLHRGDPGEIKCFFPVNMTGKDFTVDLYENESSYKPRATVVDCYFIGTKRNCDVMPGFSFNCTDDTVQTVRVVNATEQCAGVYRCCIQGLLDTRSNYCTVDYTEDNIEDSKLTVPGNVLTKGKGGMDLRDPGTDPTSPQSTSLIVGLCVGAGVLLAVGIILIIKSNQIKSNCQRVIIWTRKEEESNRPKKNLIYNPLSANPVVTV